MAKNTILLGALLTILGGGTFALMGFDPAKVTALLPAAFGGAFLLLGGGAVGRPAWSRILTYVAVGVAVLAFLGTAPGLIRALALLAGAEVARPAAAVEQGVMAVLCLGFVGRAVRWWMDTPRADLQEEA